MVGWESGCGGRTCSSRGIRISYPAGTLQRPSSGPLAAHGGKVDLHAGQHRSSSGERADSQFQALEISV